MLRTAASLGTAFNWNSATPYLDYCIVPKDGKFIILNPDGEKFCNAHDSIDDAKLEIQVIKLETAIIELMSDWLDQKLITSEQYNLLLEQIRRDGSHYFWQYAYDIAGNPKPAITANRA